MLPGDGTSPTPSLELQADIEEETTGPTVWSAWRGESVKVVNPFPLPDPPATTKATETVRIAPDFEFWQRLM